MPSIYFKDSVLNTTDEEFATFANSLIYVKAAGGIVHNTEGLLLMLFRRGQWDLPKGHLEKGEDLCTCALREVGEETGLINLKAEKQIAVTHHIYAMHGKLYLKETTWFSMQYEGGDELRPQTEEDIELVCWASREEFKERLQSSFASLKQLSCMV
ncbi:MAG: NUDIX domain-containing protein [Bacteroidales bacterium]|nr:NUDIX domain-containing protein [Bacteroidales bacterium]